MSEQILIVDDEKEIADLIEVYLKNDGYTVYKFYNGLDALECIETQKMDLAILDVMLPDIDGFRICQKIREQYYYPIIMLTAKVEDTDKIMGLTIGADDYITKPFNPLEVVARVKTQLRRYVRYNNAANTKEKDTPIAEHDVRGLIINKNTHKCTLYGKEVTLTPIEFSILWYLCENRGKVIPSEELFENVWGEQYLDNNNTVMAHIGRLREKLNEPAKKPKFIKTVWEWDIPLKNKRNSQRDDYRLLKNKLLIRTFGMLFFAFAFLAALYSLFLRGHIANAFVGFLDNFVYHDYDRALNVYSMYIRNYMSLFFIVLSLILFAIILRFYLNEFSKYFKEINRGIDALIEENIGDIVLSSELTVTEKKINHIKHTLEQRKLATELAEQRKNDLVVYLAHDLKTPLTSVIGYLTLLRDENQISEELREKYLSISLEKAEYLEDLINEFFEITRFNLSNITLEYSMVNLTRMLEQLTYEFKPMFLEKNLKCELEIVPDTMIKCDVNKMQRVFDNLLRNAVNYSFADSTIRIVSTQNEGNLNIKFTNFGNTIPQEKLERIFEQFYRLDTARSSRSGGAGLGLAIAKEIVELHGGSITAKSENDIIEFEVTIPLL